MAQRPNYGIDAPKVIRNLIVAGVFFLFIALTFPKLTIVHTEIVLFPGVLWPAGCSLLCAGLMLLYSTVGKFQHRDRMVGIVRWTGSEQVLDVGTGRGLLVLGAAKRLTTGHATGIDIWNTEDLSGNGPQALLRNASLEGVSDRIDVVNDDVREMSFREETFDVVFSNLCLHNIYQAPGRARACQEIARVLKPGGLAVISDYKHTRQYAEEFAKLGLEVETWPLDWTGTFPPLRIVLAHKPE